MINTALNCHPPLYIKLSNHQITTLRITAAPQSVVMVNKLGWLIIITVVNLIVIIHIAMCQIKLSLLNSNANEYTNECR